MSRSTGSHKFRADRERLRKHAGSLYKLRRRLPKPARPFVTAMIEQIYQIDTEADLKRIAPYMRYEQRRLDEMLRTLSTQPRDKQA